MNKQTIFIILAVILIGGGIYYATTVKQTSTDTPEELESTEEETVSVSDSTYLNQPTVDIMYTNDGYSPNEITVSVGTEVVFVNNSTGGMWTASAVHPTHEELPGLDQGEVVASDGSYSYTFDKVGTWNFHNHVMPNHTGTVIVVE